MKGYFYLIISVVVILAIALFYFIYKNKSDKDEFVIDKDSGKKLKIEGASDLDERFVDKVMGSVKREEMVRYIESEMEITKRAIENFKSDPEKIKRYQNRLKRLEELKEKIR